MWMILNILNIFYKKVKYCKKIQKYLNLIKIELKNTLVNQN